MPTLPANPKPTNPNHKIRAGRFTPGGLTASIPAELPMPLRTSTLLLLSAAALSAAEAVSTTAPSLVAHEWGTFTSVASENGDPTMWMSLDGPAELPCFVHRQIAGITKGGYAIARMETPVIYFY